jgi:hypothetical protein
MSQTKNTFKRMMHLSLLASVGFAALLLVSAPALAQVLGDAYSFAILGGSAVNANGTGSLIDGDVGVSPGSSITGFPAQANTVPPFSYSHSADTAANNARASTLTLYNFLAAAGGAIAIPPGLDGQNLGPGTYTTGAALLVGGGTLTLSGPGTYIFQVTSSLITGVGSNVVLNGVDPCTVFWQVTSLATLDGATFPGTVVAAAGVHLGTGASLTGRALAAAGGDVTMAGSNTVGGCSAPVLAPTTLSRPGPLPGGTVGAAISDTKTLSGGTNPAGTITFTLYGPNDDFCTLGAIFTSPPVTVNGNGDYGSGPYTPTAAGTYRWIAAYSGDGSNAPSTTLCNDLNESVVVAATPGPTAVPTLSEWGMIIFMMLVGLISIYYLRRQKAKA